MRDAIKSETYFRERYNSDTKYLDKWISKYIILKNIILIPINTARLFMHSTNFIQDIHSDLI